MQSITRRYGRCISNKLFLPVKLLIVLVATCYTLQGYSQSNDHIFPASARARAFIDFDSKGFIISGKRCFLVSAGMEYARVPRALWRDRLLRLQKAGFNCVEIYTFWNFHEPREGKFNFSGDHDLNYFLQLLRQLGMYAIVRIGPYYCAEWDNGGYPQWLYFKKGVRVREHNAAFEQYTDRFFNRLLPVVCNNQINRGGAVIMVQLENEHNDGWGTVMPNGYFRHLREKALSLGLEVPYFFSGLHHASDPAGNGLLDDSTRPNPWFSTEFWSVWYSAYGSDSTDAHVYERRTWKIIAHGGGGYNYYMAHGGTNFGYTNNDEDAASYDYGAAVGQAGDLRPIYYSFKRAAWFARSFEQILANGVDATKTYSRLTVDTNVVVTARRSPDGDIIFFDNPHPVPVQLHITAGNDLKLPAIGPLTLAPGEIFPVVHHFPLNDAITLQWAPVRLLGVVKQGNTSTLVIYGEPGSPAELHFLTTAPAVLTNGGAAFTATPAQVHLQTRFSAADHPLEYSFTVGNKKLRVLLVSRQLADYTWFTGPEKQHYIVCGPAYINNLTVQSNHIALIAEHPLQDSLRFPVWIYDSRHGQALSEKKTATAAPVTSPVCSPWQVKDAAMAAAAGYDDKQWKYSDTPLPMGADGDSSADAWYRTAIDVPAYGSYSLQVEGAGRTAWFVNGRMAGTGDLGQDPIALTLPKGRHTLAIFTAHSGRDKLAGYMGPIDSVDNKGLWGKALLMKGGDYMHTLQHWRFLKARRREEGNQGLPSTDNPGWKDYTIGSDVFATHEGFGWFTTTLAKPPAGISQIVLSFRSVDENATVFVNGKAMGHHEGWNRPFSITIHRADTIQQPLQLMIFIENYSNEGGIDRPVRVYYTGEAQPVTGWRMRGGPGNPQDMHNWKTLTDSTRAGNPYFFRSGFSLPAVAVPGAHLIWRVATTGLGHGSVWVNGHNLGRYPEKVPVTGLYIPECWLNTGRNTLVIYDEDGKGPGQVSIWSETAAGRVTEIWSN